MKYFAYGKIDSQRRVNLFGLIPHNSKVYFYLLDDESSMLHVTIDDGTEKVPEFAKRTVDGKGRMILPKFAVMKGDYFKIAVEDEGVILKFYKEMPD